MNATVVRYQAKAERVDENQGLIEKVFADLEARQPDGFTYKVLPLWQCEQRSSAATTEAATA